MILVGGRQNVALSAAVFSTYAATVDDKLFASRSAGGRYFCLTLRECLQSLPTSSISPVLQLMPDCLIRSNWKELDAQDDNSELEALRGYLLILHALRMVEIVGDLKRLRHRAYQAAAGRKEGAQKG